MSYNVAICTPPVPLDDEAAWGAVDVLIDAKGPVPQVFRTLHDRLTARYPCICSLPDETVDDEGVWSDGPLWNDFGHRAAELGMLFTRVEEVLPFLVDTANELGSRYLTGLALASTDLQQGLSERNGDVSPTCGLRSYVRVD